MKNDILRHIDKFEGTQKVRLLELYELILMEIPQAEQIISYNMPCFRLQKNVIYFDGFKKHLGLFPTAFPIEQMKEELRAFKTSKGTIQLPYDHELPVEMIKKIIQIRLKQMQIID